MGALKSLAQGVSLLRAIAQSEAVKEARDRVLKRIAEEASKVAQSGLVPKAVAAPAELVAELLGRRPTAQPPTPHDAAAVNEPSPLDEQPAVERVVSDRVAPSPGPDGPSIAAATKRPSTRSPSKAGAGGTRGRKKADTAATPGRSRAGKAATAGKGANGRKARGAKKVRDKSPELK